MISFSAFTIQPMSASVPRGETALFMCAGEGDAFWTINGQSSNDPASEERGVKVTYQSASNSTLTIPGTMENDDVSIQCLLILPSKIVYSPVVFLTVHGRLCIDDK